MSYLFNLFKNKEFVQCEENIQQDLKNNQMFRLLNNDKNHPCNSKLIEEDVNNLIEQYKKKGFHIKSLPDTIFASYGEETKVNVGILIYKK
jgi:hypothetical protein